MKPIRWLLVSAQHEPRHGGIGTYISRFIDAAIGYGWEVDLITRPGSRLPRATRCHLIATDDDSPAFTPRLDALRHLERVRPYRYGLWSHAVAKLLMELETNYDAVEFVDCQAEGFVSLCSRRVRERWAGVPMLIHAHTPMFVEEDMNGCDPGRFGRSIYHSWEKHALEAADGVMTTSRLLAERLPDPRSMAVAPFPLRLHDSSCRTVPAMTPTILLVGSIQPRKGVECWARSLNRVFAQHDLVHAELIGSDTLTGPGQTSMVTFTTNLVAPQFRDRFHWRGDLDYPEVRRRIASASLVAVPSRLESFSFVAAEAMEALTPVVASDGVGLIEHVPSLPCVQVGDHAALAEAQLHVLTEPDKAAVLAQRCLRELRSACDPGEILNRRLAFVDSFHKSGGSAADSLDHAADDAIDWMDGVLRSIEVEERSLACSSVSS